MSLRTCLACGWVHFGMTREAAEKGVADFNAFYDDLTAEQQNAWYGGERARIEVYERCFLCHGSYQNFREFKPGDLPGDGHTIQPIIASDK